MPIARSVALALVLVLVLTLPTFAQYAPPTVTKTWTLTLYGDVPSDESFGVEYRDPAGRDVVPLSFCGPTAASACIGNDTSYTRTVVVPHGFDLHFRIFRGQPFSPQFEAIEEGWETMTADSTTAAHYRLPADTGMADPPVLLRAYMPMIAPARHRTQ